jgi:L-2-hydroxyglutarate oxidase LhgO
MEKVDITIIGAGIIGLTVASRLSHLNKKILLLERHGSFGQESSSRNSEVLHAGIYYPTDSLKAKLCVEGNRKLYETAEKYNIPCKKTGKLIISTNDTESEKIHELYNLGRANGVEGLTIMSKTEVKEFEPFINANLALYSPETGIIDTHQLMAYYEYRTLENDVIIAYNSNVLSIEKDNIFTVSTRSRDGETTQILSEIVINCAGLGAGTIAETAGIDIDREGYRIYPCKGEYFSVSDRHRNKLKHLVYPAPTNISLGIHTVLDMSGGLKLGPNAFYVDEIDYQVDLSHKQEFYESVKVYLPFLKPDDLSPDMSGCRAKVQAPDEGFRDFIIREESNKGLPGLINLLGFESPGLTSAPAITEYVEEIVKKTI